MIGKLYKIDKNKTTIKNIVHLTKPIYLTLNKVQFNNSLDNSTNIKNTSFLVSGYYVGDKNIISIGDKIEIEGRKYEIKNINSTSNAMRKSLFNNYFEGV